MASISFIWLPGGIFNFPYSGSHTGVKNMIDDLQNWLSGIFASLNYSNYNHLILYAFEVD